MKEAQVGKQEIQSQVQAISRTHKERLLLSLSEDDFRDSIVRPLFLRTGLKDGRELCGPTEEGKDTYFVSQDELGMSTIYAVQTKKGSVNMTAKCTENLLTIETQMRTALETSIVLLKDKRKRQPAKVILCASGKINDPARAYIMDRLHSDPRLEFMGRDELIPMIDDYLPEIWFQIGSDLLPYVRAIIQNADDSSGTFSMSQVLPADIAPAAATDSMFVPLKLFQPRVKVKKRSGQIRETTEFISISIGNLLSRKKRLLLVVGEAGAGKSTILRRAAYMIAKRTLEDMKNYNIPIVLRAMEVFANPQSFEEMAAEATTRLSHSSTPAFKPSDMVEGRLTVMVDALDELPDDAARVSVLKSIEEFHAQYPLCRIVVSSRDHRFVDELHELRPFERWQISRIDIKQAADLLDRLEKHKALPPDSCKEILKRIHDAHGIDLNPLIVTVFAASTDVSRKDIPANITELFKKFSEIMLGRWDPSKGIEHQYHFPLKDFLLQCVAYHMHSHRQTSIEIAEFKDLARDELAKRDHGGDVDRLCEEILIRSGLFRVVGTRLEFRHLIIQEFFAGRGIPDCSLLDTLIRDEWWARGIVFYFGDNPSDPLGITRVAVELEKLSEDQLFQPMKTLGLAIQACYLLEIDDKLTLVRIVIDGLAKARNHMQPYDLWKQFPLTGFLLYYLSARDSVACNMLSSKHQLLTDEWLKDISAPAGLNEARIFWVIVGLIEIGALQEVSILLEDHIPSEISYILAIDLGLFNVQRAYITERAERRMISTLHDRLIKRIKSTQPGVFQAIDEELEKVASLPDTENGTAIPPIQESHAQSAE